MFTVLMTIKSYCPLWKGFMIIYSLFAAACKVLWHKNGLSHPSVGSSFLWLSLRWLTNKKNCHEENTASLSHSFKMFCIDDRIPSLELYAFNNILSTQKKKKTRIILIQFDRPFIQFKVFSPKSLFCKPSTMKLKLKVDFKFFWTTVIKKKLFTGSLKTT